jgi:hypothetical protein
MKMHELIARTKLFTKKLSMDTDEFAQKILVILFQIVKFSYLTNELSLVLSEAFIDRSMLKQ